MRDDTVQIGMVAGEASGDMLGAHLMRALAVQRPALRFAGIGGPQMEGQGFDSWYPMEKLSVRGYVEVFRHYREIMGIRRQLSERLLKTRPALFIGVDAPDFNLELERQLREAGIPSIQYVGPSVWAWRAWRMRRIARSVTHLLALFPFEAPLYEKAGIPVSYVGHPLADVVPFEVSKTEARTQLRLPPNRLIVALLPGSRRSELEYLGETFVKAARRMHDEVRDVHFVCPASSRGTRDLFETVLRQHGGAELPVTVLFGHSHEALAAADLALVASGTASLEAALFKTPMVIAYRMSPVTWMLMRRMLYLPWIGLPNILAGTSLVPEFVQDEATPGKLAAALIALMQDAPAQRRQIECFQEIHASLRQNTAEKAAAAVLDVLDRARA